MSNENLSYRQIFKATSIFGGVQFINILISVIRSKCIAILLGPLGMGIAGLLNSTITLLSSIANFGIGVSSIKDIAVANEHQNNARLLQVISIVNKLVWLTGIFGMILTLVLSPLLSKLTFNNYDYTWSFIFLSITLFLGQLTLGKDAVLQGTRQIKWLAYANISSSIVSLLVTLPLYFLYGINGIVPAMIILSCTTLAVTQLFYKKLNLSLPPVSFKKSWEEGLPMLKLGFFLSLSGIIATGCTYAVRIFITRIGGLDDVGFYNAGFGIVNSYVGIIFTAMATDYYPRLSGVINEKLKYIETVNQQGNVALLILGPIVTIFVVFANLAITMLYSKDFLPINTMIQYAMIGIFFKAASWLMGFIVLAKGSTQLFFWCELIANIYMTFLNCIGFYYGGLEGLGVSFLVGYILYAAQMFFISKKIYNFYFDISFLKLFVVQISISIIALLIMKVVDNDYISYTLGSIMVIITGIYSIYHINNIISLKSLISKFTRK
ncbi:MAG: O-antigen translocase [Chryseobacterium sp.]|uniref:O-antigen translocase n=1 Tax=Chryseobacterium sp. TaxID=1871047 RepID=UPI0025BF2953|nr:O-antigen translocase [Chryseobacterium sp.]MCJ7933002.1 O-antigen translocase [Chryseobacterium sp.]